MKQLRLCLSVILGVMVVLFLPFTTYADTASSTTPDLIISEIKIKNDTSPDGYNEFIELYNASLSSLNLNQFTVEYFNSPAPSPDNEPVKKVVIADKLIMPEQSLVLAANKDQITNSLSLPFTSLSDSGGLVRVKGIDGTFQDQVAWTSTSSLAIAPVVFLSSSTTNKNRSFIRSSDNQGKPALASPTWELLAPTPHADELAPVPIPEPDSPSEQTSSDPTQTPVTETPDSDNQLPTVPLVTDTETTPQTAEPLAVLPLQISELLPNPAPPAQDSTDEYVELYNPNNEAVDLKEYKLQTGNSYSYSYTFSEGTLLPREYRAFYVSQTNSLLANSGGRSRLLGPAGQIIFETAAYDEAKEGMAWAYIIGPLAGDWQWTTTPTPNETNVLTLPLVKVAAVKSTSPKTASKPKATAKVTTGKKASTATTKAKTTKAGTNGNAGGNDDAETTVSSLHPGIVAAIGALVLGYGVWEYHGDIRNRFYQLRRYRASRRATRIEV